MLLKISLFVEDDGHRLTVGPLVQRIAREEGVDVELAFVNATGGSARVFDELKKTRRAIENGGLMTPDVFIAAVDGNCVGFVARRSEIEQIMGSALLSISVFAVPDPHIERWLLLDSAAFKHAVGVGCSAPDQKCERDRYKRLLAEAVRSADVLPILGGLEYAEDIVDAMDIMRCSVADSAFSRFIGDLRGMLRMRKGL